MKNSNNNVEGNLRSINFNYNISVNVAGLKCDVNHVVRCHINNNEIDLEVELEDYNNLIFNGKEVKNIFEFFKVQKSLGNDFRDMIIEEVCKFDIEQQVRNDYKNLFDFMVQNNIK